MPLVHPPRFRSSARALMFVLLLLPPFADAEAQRVALLRPVPTNGALRPSMGHPDEGTAAWAQDSVQYPRTYWVEGGLVGGLALGTFSALVAGAFCGDPDSGDVPCGPAVLGGLLVGGALGFTIGSLVGGSVTKPPRAAGPPGAPPGAGRAVSGRLLGTAILVPTGVVVGMTSSNSLGGALVGGLAGFAVGQLLGTIIDRQAAPAGAE